MQRIKNRVLSENSQFLTNTQKPGLQGIRNKYAMKDATTKKRANSYEVSKKKTKRKAIPLNVTNGESMDRSFLNEKEHMSKIYSDHTLSSRPHNIAFSDTLSSFSFTSTEIPAMIKIENEANDSQNIDCDQSKYFTGQKK